MCSAQVRTFEIDSEGSDLSFSVTHLGFLTVEGVFSEFTGKCTVKKGKLQSVEGRILVRSINTNDASRDESLKSDAYLDGGSYPVITFVYTGVDISEESSILTGKLKLKDTEKEISMPFEFSLSENKEECSLKIFTSINRSEFNLDFGAMDAMVGDEVKVKLRVIGVESY